ncbi:MAG: VOC family protein, partial [Methylophilaceae bacterium]|nr:VOC family protein [Methylophilaceae bacterium]
ISYNFYSLILYLLTGFIFIIHLNWNTKDYEHGNAFGHIAIEVDDIYKACEEIKNKGVKVIRDPGPMMGSRLLLAFIEDPNGYKIELIEKGTF